jgi:hypothetical protein
VGMLETGRIGKKRRKEKVVKGRKNRQQKT